MTERSLAETTPSASRRCPLCATVGALALLGLLASAPSTPAGDLLLIEARTLERDGTGLLNLLPSADVLASRDVLFACADDIVDPEDVLVFDVQSGLCSSIPRAERPANLELHEPVMAHGDLGDFDSVDVCLAAHDAALVDSVSGLATCFNWFECDQLAPVISGPDQVCAGEQAILDAGAGYVEYSWQPGGETTREIVVTPWVDTEYDVQVTDDWGCSGTAAHLVVALALPEPEITGPSSMCTGETVTLDAGAGWAAYDWSTGATTRTIDVSPVATTAYTVEVTNPDGCRGASPDHLLTVDEVWEVEVADQTVGSDETVRACGVILAGPNVEVIAPAHLVLQAGQTVALRNGFAVQSGATLTVRLEAVLNED